MPQSGKIQHFTLTLLLSVACICSQGQSLKDHLQKGDRFFLRKDYENALTSYEEALAIDGENALANYRAGVSSLEEENFSQAVAYLEKFLALNAGIEEDFHYHLGVAYQKDHQYSKAAEQFETLRGKNKRLAPLATRRKAECLLADSLMRMPPKGTIERVSGAVNTAFSELAPVVTGDGKKLFFTSNRTEDEYQIKSRTNSGDVYVSHWAGSAWNTPEKLGESVNVRAHEMAAAVSADGQTLFLIYEDGGGDIYTSAMENGVWTKPAPLNRFINHPQYRESSACMSPDGTRLYFSSNRPGGKGGFDIYVSVKGENGDWGRPSNLGSAINTRSDEEAPFASPDGETLYFASDGHATLGDKDIFRSVLRGGKWSAPENLGYPVNSSGYDSHMTLTNDQSTGYFASRRQGKKGDTDIYKAVLTDRSGVAVKAQENYGENPGESGGIITVLRGVVIDAENSSPIRAKLRLVDNNTHAVLHEADTDAAGNFEISIPRGGNYGLSTHREGYLFSSMNFDLPPFQAFREIDTQVLMVRAKAGSKIVLKNLFFDVGMHALSPQSTAELEEIHNMLVSNPHWNIRINGHTDNQGSRDENVALSLKRAQAVVDYLVSEGIDSSRLEAKGFGADQPLVSNDDEREGRQLNRRTEIEITSQ